MDSNSIGILSGLLKPPLKRELWLKGRQEVLAPRCQYQTGSSSQCAASARKGYLTCLAHRQHEAQLRSELGDPEDYFPVVLPDLGLQLPQLEVYQPQIEFLQLDLNGIFSLPQGLFTSPPRRVIWLVRFSRIERWREPREGEVSEISRRLMKAENFFEIKEDVGIQLGSRPQREFQQFFQTERKLASLYREVSQKLGKGLCRPCFLKVAKPAYKQALQAAIRKARAVGDDLRVRETWQEINAQVTEATVSACLKTSLPSGRKAGAGGDQLCRACTAANKGGSPKRHGNRGFGRHPSKVRRADRSRRDWKGIAGAGRNAQLQSRPRPADWSALEQKLQLEQIKKTLQELFKAPEEKREDPSPLAGIFNNFK